MCKHGENIYKRKDGRYEGRYVIGRNDQGRTRFGYVYGRSYTLVRRELLKRKADLWVERERIPKSGMTLRRWMQQYLLGERFAHLKPRSRQIYQATFERHIAPFLGAADLGQITTADVHQLIALLNRKKLAPNTVAGILRLLSSVLRAAQEEGLIRRNPCSKVVLHQPPRDEQRVLSVREQEQLKSAALSTGNFAALLALYTGLRLGEICALQWNDVDWARGMLTVRHTAQRLKSAADSAHTEVVIGPPKSIKSRRAIPLPAFLLKKLEELRASADSAYVLGKGERPAEPRSIQRQFVKLIQPLDMPGVHFHTLRHTFATRLLELGIDVKTVSVLLGHSSTRITLEFYAHSLLDQQREAMDRLAQAYF